VTNGNFPNGGNEFGPTRASWASDGKYLLASVNRHPESDHEFLDSEVYEFSVVDGSLRPLTNRKGPDNSPWSLPTGNSSPIPATMIATRAIKRPSFTS